MTTFFKPKSPAPIVQKTIPLSPIPERTDAETQALAAEQRRKFASSRSRGRASTFLTQSGVTNPTTAARFLGASG